MLNRKLPFRVFWHATACRWVSACRRVDGPWYCRWTVVLSTEPGTFIFKRQETRHGVQFSWRLLDPWRRVHSKRRQLLALRNCVTSQKTPILNRKAKTAQILYKVVSAEAILYASHYRSDFPYSQPLAVQDGVQKHVSLETAMAQSVWLYVLDGQQSTD